MKKTLIALAALAATGAFAQNLTLTGGVDVGVQSATQATAGGNITSVKNNGTYTSQIDVVGSEDLGGGMTAKLFLELDINPTQSISNDSTSTSAAYFTGTPFNGQQYVGIAGGFGEVQLGTPNAAALDNNGKMQPFGTALGSGYSGGFGRMAANSSLGISQYIGGTGGSAVGGRVIRHEKVVKYISPSFAGLRGSLEYSFGYQADGKAAVQNNTNNNNNDQYTALGLTYSNGPLNLVYSYTKDANVNGGSQFNVGAAASNAGSLAFDSAVVFHQLGGNYTFGAVTAYAGYTKTKTDNETASLGFVEDGNSWNVAGKYAVAPAIDLMANYVVRNSSYYNNAKLFGAGVDYKLSKRTTVYYRYEAIDANTDNKLLTTTIGGTTAIAGSTATVTSAVGIRHTF
jgi:predicted porin